MDYEGKAAGAVRLYFTATAWNANPAVLTLSAGAAGNAVPAVATPKNDDFAHALAIDGAKGSVDLDMASATAEAGEPPVVLFPAGGTTFGSGELPVVGPAVSEPPRGRPAASVWYDWTAPSDGHFRFDLGRRTREAEPVYVDMYTGDDIVGLDRIESNASRDGNFYAQEGEVYRVRVSNGTHRTVVYGRSTP